MGLGGESHSNEEGNVFTLSNTSLQRQLRTPDISALTLMGWETKSSPGKSTCVNRVNRVGNTPQRPPLPVCPRSPNPTQTDSDLPNPFFSQPQEGSPALYTIFYPQNFLFQYTFSTLKPPPSPYVCHTPYPSFNVKFYHFRYKENSSQ